MRTTLFYLLLLSSTIAFSQVTTNTNVIFRDKKTGKPYNGVFQHRNQQTTIVVTANYVDGLRHGATTWFHDNGKIRALGFYQMGQKNGEWTFYNEQGVISAKGEYNNNLPNGLWYYFLIDGTPNLLAQYLNGALQEAKYLLPNLVAK